MSTFDEAVKDIKNAREAIDGVVANQATEEPKSKINVQPKDTSKGHFYVSLAKSFVRITAGVCLVLVAGSPDTAFFIKTAGALLIAAEVLGIFEELV